MSLEVNYKTLHNNSDYSVQSHLQYLAKDSRQPKVYLERLDKLEESARYDGQFTPCSVSIHNARLRNRPFTLENEGFMLARQATQVKDFQDPIQLKTIYEQELTSLMKKIIGAHRLKFINHTLRYSSQLTSAPAQINAPILYVHNDFSVEGGLRRLIHEYRDEPQTVDKLLKGDYWIINVWRSSKGPILNHFLALCDVNTLTTEDMVNTDLSFKERVPEVDRVSEIQLSHFNPDHSWYYYPQMQMDEVLIFKTFDSTRKDGLVSLHCGAFDPGLSKDLPPRNSIESRYLVFFD